MRNEGKFRKELKEREKKITCVCLNYNIFEKKKKIGETKNVKKFDDEK